MLERFEGEDMYAQYSAICGPIWFSFGHTNVPTCLPYSVDLFKLIC